MVIRLKRPISFRDVPLTLTHCLAAGGLKICGNTFQDLNKTNKCKMSGHDSALCLGAGSHFRPQHLE